MGSGQYETDSRPRARKDDYCDDPRRRWKNSLRPLDPGILSDVKNKKKERSHSVSSVPRSTRSRSMSPSRAGGVANLANASTASSRAKMRDAIRFEYKRPERKKLSVPARRTQSLDRRRASLPVRPPASLPVSAPAPAKPARPSLSPAPPRQSPRPAVRPQPSPAPRPVSQSPVRARSVSLPRKSPSPAPVRRREPEKPERTPMTWQAPSVVSWSARNETRSSSEQHQETSTSFESHQYQQQIQQQRLMQQHVKQMQEQEQRRSQERQSRATERKTIVPIRSSRSEQTREVKQERQERQETRREERQERQETRREEMKTASQSFSGRKQTTEKNISIPVKNYRSQSLRAREPSPAVDYPDASEDTDENDVRIADYASDKKGRKKSVQSYSKRTSITRQYPGCVIA